MRDVEITEELPTLYEEVPAARYLDRGRFDTELDRIFGAHWIMAARLEEIPDPGFLARTVARRDLVLTRDGPTVRAFHNVCSHRGAAVVDGRGEGARMRCPYHGWTYDLEGTVTALPGEKRFAGLDRQGCGLPEVHAAGWGGWAWVHLGRDPQPLDRWLGAWAGELERYEPSGQSVFGHRTDEVPLNWKAGLDAFIETYHVAFVHPETVGRLVQGKASRFGYDGPHSRMVIPIRRSPTEGLGLRRKETEAEGPRVPRKQKDLLPEQSQDHCNYAIFPNLVLDLLPTWGIVLQFEPVAVDRTEIRTWTVSDPIVSERQQVAMELQWREFGKVLDEDLRLLHQVGKGMRSPGFAVVRLGGEEERLVHFHRAVEEALG